MHDRRILQLLVLTILSSIIQLASSLSGEHVCTRLENHTITLKETYTEPVIVQTFTWCLQVPPRCSKTRVENRERYRIKTTVEERNISECCNGYVLEELNPSDPDAELKCVPFCESCINGLCLEPNVCQCNIGYGGDNCAYECPLGSWGRDCMKRCECAFGRSCNPVTGICECPVGWEGVGCKLPCAEGRWGLGCQSICKCGDDKDLSFCNPVTGDCDRTGKNWNAEIQSSNNNTTEEGEREQLFRTVQVSGLILPSTSTVSNILNTNKQQEESNYQSSSVTEFKDFGSTEFSKTTEFHEDRRLKIFSETPEDLNVVKPEYPVRDLTEFQSTTTFNELTQFEEIISQTVTGTRFTITPRLTSEDIIYANNDLNNDRDSGIKTIDAPHPSYVKTVQKEQVPQIQYDTTVLIVVGSVVSLCITTLAALMVFYLRSKVFESIPLSIYDSNKNESQDQEKRNTIRRSLNITSTTLPPLPTFVNPVFAANPENALITFDAAELNKHYDNRTGTISIRVSRNMRDLLESHYDRPPAATCRHTVEQNTEHVYDEIPLTAPLCVRKEA